MAKQKGEFWWGFHPENGKKRCATEAEALEWETGIPTLEVEEVESDAFSKSYEAPGQSEA